MIEFLQENRGTLVVVTVIVWAWFIWAIVRARAAAATAGGPLTRTGLHGAGGRIAATPGAKKQPDIAPQARTSTGGGLAPPIEKGMAEHHVRSAAATAKLTPQVDQKRRPTESLTVPPPAAEDLKRAPTALPADADRAVTDTLPDEAAMQGLFAGLKDAPPADAPMAERKEGPATGAFRRANRIEEIGFHRQIESDRVAAEKPGERPAFPPAPQAPPAPPSQVTSAAPAAPVAPPAPPIAPPKPRTQTAELDDILKRIDQVLAEAPSAPAAIAATAPVAPPPPKPPEKLDPSDVLKRIDQALAESQGTHAELTMLDPDWEDDAKRAATDDETSRRTAADRKATAQPASERSATAVPPPAPPKPVIERTASSETPAGTAKKDELPDWARSDIQDEDLKDEGDDGKGGQQKLF